MKKPILFLILFIAFCLTAIAPALAKSNWSGDGKVVVNIIDGLGVFSAKGEVINTVTGELAKVKCFGNMHEDVWFIKLREITRNNKK